MQIRKLFTSIIFLAIFSFITSCGAQGNDTSSEAKQAAKDLPVDTALQQRLKDFATRPRPNGKFAFHVYDLTADKPVYGCNDSLALPSASCMKLLTGVAGLHLLGTNYYYKTAILTRGKKDGNGTLQGDLAFKGSLDPQLMPVDLNDFSRFLHQEGIRRISGKLYIDLTIKEPVKSEKHWYPWDLTFSKYGLFYKGEKRVLTALKASLRAQGIAIADSQVVTARLPKGFQCRHIFKRSIDDVIKRMWKNSSNTQATALLYTIGHRANPHAFPVDAGVAYLRKFLTQDLQQNGKGLCIHDGCGLCTHNRLSPVALTAVLRYGYANGAIRSSLERNLSHAGIDGTLAREMTGQKLRGKVRAKTGTLSHPYGISSLAGFCEGPNGHTLAFAIMDSEMSVLDARVLQRKFCEAMVIDKKRPS